MDIEWAITYGFQSLVIAGWGYLFVSLRIQIKRGNATQSGVKALLRDRLISAIHKAKKQGFIYVHELENIDKMYTEYVTLGANGTIVHMMKEISKLPTKTDLN